MTDLEHGFTHCIEDLQDSLKVAEEIQDLLKDMGDLGESATAWSAEPAV
ncbi:MAG: hypothetical protein LJE84_08200 [Gammaproteobacteria bacterium]|nr:hypothetical protein [Gammaproteobacteria bacterium]